jgi:hypothetical protein
MLPKPESACFVIADISGYTGFLAGVELEHAQDIIADVMDTREDITMSKGRASATKNAMLRFVARGLIARQNDLCPCRY